MQKGMTLLPTQASWLMLWRQERHPIRKTEHPKPLIRLSRGNRLTEVDLWKGGCLTTFMCGGENICCENFDRLQAESFGLQALFRLCNVSSADYRRDPGVLPGQRHTQGLQDRVAETRVDAEPRET